MPPTVSPSTDSSLLQRVQSQDPQAWRTFVDLYGPLIYAWGRRQGLSREDAGDMTQETFGAVARSIGQFSAVGGSLRGWLWTVAHNKIRDHFRRGVNDRAAGGTDMQVRLQELPGEPPQEPTDSADLHELRNLLGRGLEQVQTEFEPRTWQAFVLTVLEAEDTTAVATKLGMTANHVRQAKSRVLRRLRDQLGELSP